MSNSVQLECEFVNFVNRGTLYKHLTTNTRCRRRRSCWKNSSKRIPYKGCPFDFHNILIPIYRPWKSFKMRRCRRWWVRCLFTVQKLIVIGLFLDSLSRWWWLCQMDLLTNSQSNLNIITTCPWDKMERSNVAHLYQFARNCPWDTRLACHCSVIYTNNGRVVNGKSIFTLQSNGRRYSTCGCTRFPSPTHVHRVSAANEIN